MLEPQAKSITAERVDVGLAPLEQNERAPAARVANPERKKLCVVAEAIRIGMKNRNPGGILVDQGERGARHLDVRRHPERAAKRAREERLSGAEIPRQNDQIAGREERSETAGETNGRAPVGEIQ